MRCADRGRPGIVEVIAIPDEVASWAPGWRSAVLQPGADGAAGGESATSRCAAARRAAIPATGHEVPVHRLRHDEDNTCSPTTMLEAADLELGIDHLQPARRQGLNKAPGGAVPARHRGYEMGGDPPARQPAGGPSRPCAGVEQEALAGGWRCAAARCSARRAEATPGHGPARSFVERPGSPTTDEEQAGCKADDSRWIHRPAADWELFRDGWSRRARPVRHFGEQNAGRLIQAPVASVERLAPRSARIPTLACLLHRQPITSEGIWSRPAPDDPLALPGAGAIFPGWGHRNAVPDLK